jgi:peroxiredoxin
MFWYKSVIDGLNGPDQNRNHLKVLTPPPMKLILAIAATILISNVFSDEPKQAVTGDVIPDVSVKDANGTAVKLRDAVKTKPAVVIFYRGGWCPYCTRHLMALAGVEKEIAEAGYQILAISADKPAKLAETPDRDKLAYTLLSDASMEAAKDFGITFKVPDELVAKYKNEYQIDIEAASGETHHILPHPAVFLVDKEGIIRFVHINEDYKVRLDPAKILQTVRNLPH